MRCGCAEAEGTDRPRSDSPWRLIGCAGLGVSAWPRVSLLPPLHATSAFCKIKTSCLPEDDLQREAI